MKWPSPKDIVAFTEKLVPDLFTLTVANPTNEASSLPSLIEDWYPDIRTGSESYHLESSFYSDILNGKSCFTETDFLPLVLKDPESNICGLVTFWKNSRAMHISSALGVLAPNVRGKKLAFVGPQVLEQLGKACGAGQVHYYVTLRNIAQQLVAEKLDYKLAGINPAWDCDAISSTQTKRVYEAIYAKVLAAPGDIEVPLESNLSDQVKNLFKVLYPELTLSGDRQIEG